MKPLRFYEHFACAYGTIWLILFAVSTLTQSRIDTGLVGLFGFPAAALVCAIFRASTVTAAGRVRADDPSSFRLFLETYPIYRGSPPEDQARGYAIWMDQRNVPKS
jgi:hypothetical protein